MTEQERFTIPPEVMEAALNAALQVVQNHMSVTAGDVAGIYFGAGSARQAFATLMQGYADTERLFLADDIDIVCLSDMEAWHQFVEQNRADILDLFPTIEAAESAARAGGIRFGGGALAETCVRLDLSASPTCGEPAA